MSFPKQHIKYGVAGTVCILLIVYLVGQLGFNTYLNRYVYPSLEAGYGIQIQSQSASCNMLTGVIRVRDISLHTASLEFNKALASCGHIRVQLHPSTWWFKHPIRIQSLEISDGRVDLIRNRAGKVNFEVFKSAQGDREIAPVIAGNHILHASKPSQPIEWLIDEFRCGVDIHYVDQNRPELDHLFYVALSGRTLSSIEEHSWGSIHGVVELLEGKRPFGFFGEAQVAPLLDLQKPTFYMTGETELLDGAWLDKWLDDTGVQVESFRVDAQVFSKEGRLEGSTLAAHLKSCSFTFSDQVYAMNQLQFSVPLEGTIQQPSIDIQTALEEVLHVQISTLIGSFAHDLIEEITQLDEPVKAIVDEVADFLEVPSQEIKNEAAKWVDKGLKEWDKLFQE